MAANIQETLNEGLKREYTITVDKADLDVRHATKINKISKDANIKGFRKGKVPPALIQERYSASVTGELLEEIVKEQMSVLFQEYSLKPSAQPSVVPTTLYEHGGDNDFVFTVSVEVMPDIPEFDLSNITLNEYVFPVNEEEIDEEIASTKEQHGEYIQQDDSYIAADKDRVVIDFKGFIDDEAFPGGEAKNHELVLGSGAFIPGFEEQLIGAKAGEDRKVNVSFPDEYHAPEFAGKEAVFEVTVHAVKVLKEAELNEYLFKKLNVKDEDELRNTIRESFEARAKQRVRTRSKQELFDALDNICTFEVPQNMVDGEFNQILETAKQSGEDDIENEAKQEELKTIANRRVRLGLYLAHLGEKNGIEIKDTDLTVQLYEQAASFGIPPQQLMEYYQKNQDAVQGLRGRALEEKAVDFLFDSLTRKKVEITPEDFTKLESEEDDDAELAQEEEKKPKKKAPAKKKTAAKKEDEGNAA